jgi:hypothetical protein
MAAGMTAGITSICAWEGGGSEGLFLSNKSKETPGFTSTK